MDNNITRLPDAYYKLIGGNLYNLLQIAYLTSSIAMEDFENINTSRDLHEAAGQTLDYYGAMVGEARNGATDEQYLTKILNKIGVNISGSDVNSVINAIAQTLSADPSSISITEGNCNVTVKGLTIAMLTESGYSADEIQDLIASLIPVGVALGRSVYAGTLLVTSRKYTWMAGLADQTLLTDYPYLWSAWFDGQESLRDGDDIGLSGDGTVPSSFNAVSDPAEDLNKLSEMKTTGTYNGGTLGSISN